VHRLDVDTSGVVLFATEEASWRRLRAAFREGRVEKVYRALVRGHPGSGSLELSLVTARHRPARVRVLEGEEARRARGARRARQSFRTLEVFPDAALVEVRPETGFLHQIRATLAHQGSPVLGDRAYGPPGGDRSGALRQMLHAASLAFEEIRAESPDPADFAALLARLRAETTSAPPAEPRATQRPF
jgi:23S rRNA pseudouridine1911/1915/1917 synthase